MKNISENGSFNMRVIINKNLCQQDTRNCDGCLSIQGHCAIHIKKSNEIYLIVQFLIVITYDYRIRNNFD